MKKLLKKFANIFSVNILTLVLLLFTFTAVVLNNICSYRLNKENAQRYELSRCANEFMDGSRFLTRQVRAYVATQEQEYYDAYWNEVRVDCRRDNAVARLKELGITYAEDAIVDKMFEISDGLVMVEAEAMELVSAGYKEEALETIYGEYYTEKITQIEDLCNSFIKDLDKRTDQEVAAVSRWYNLVNSITWIMVGLTVALQLLQNRTLRKLTYISPLTRGDNYTKFCERMRSGREVSGPGYIISVDIKDFGVINDTYGADVGDKVIYEVGQVLMKSLQKDELCGHMSGDRFVLFLHGESIEAISGRIIVLQSKMSDLAYKLGIFCIVPLFGICEVDDTQHPELAYNNANLAKQYATESAGTFYYIFSPELKQKILSEYNLIEAFPRALAQKQFEIWYQPKYEPVSDQMVSAEALVRWRWSDGRLLAPKEFLQLFDRDGMISQLDEYSFEAVCMQMRKWLDEGRNAVPVSVNISSSSLGYVNIVDRYLAILHKHNIPAKLIQIEVSEAHGAFTPNIEHNIRMFKANGFCILVEGFGGGRTSIYTLTKDCFDNIQIDKALIDSIGTSRGDYLISSVIELIHDFGLTVTAVGVESETQLAFLVSLKCDYLQGYYFSRPQPEDKFRELLI